MRATNERFVRLRNMADLKSGQTNADLLIALMDRYEGKNGPNNKEMHSVVVQANATESVFELYAQREAKKSDFECQWPCGEASPCRGHPKTQTMQTGDCRSCKRCRLCRTCRLSSFFFFFLILIFIFTFDSHMFWFWFAFKLSIDTQHSVDFLKSPSSCLFSTSYSLGRFFAT